MIDGAREDACAYCRLDAAAPTRCSTWPDSTAASRSSRGSTPTPDWTPGWRPWVTSCDRTWGVNYVLPEPAELPRAAVLDQRTAPGGANLSFYSNPVFDQLVGEGNQAQSNAEAIAKYNQAEDVLLEDMPIIPMFFQVEQSLFSEHVSDVTVDIFGRIDAAEVTVND